MNKSFRKMDKRGYNSYYITKKKNFNPKSTFKSSTILKVYDFSYQMSFGKQGQHRDHRNGGDYRRRNGEIFANTFQGKLAECAIYNLLKDCNGVNHPDFSVNELGWWDDSDFIIGDKYISVKSTKEFGNLMLLETKDWSDTAEYLPNSDKEKSSYDYFVLVRLKPDCVNMMKELRCLYSDSFNENKLKERIMKAEWQYDYVGYITKSDLKYLINNNFVLPKDSMLNGKIPMDAENYYCQAGDMKNIEQLVVELKF